MIVPLVNKLGEFYGFNLKGADEPIPQRWFKEDLRNIKMKLKLCGREIRT